MRLRDAGLAGALGVLLVVLVVLTVPQVLAQLPPSQGQIQPGTVLRIGNFTYSPNPSWTEERARIHRGEVSVISKDGQELQVRSIPASTSSQAYVAAAKQLSGSKAASIGSGAPIITPTGLHGLRGTFVSPAGDGTLATFGVRPNSPVAGGVAFVATNQGDNGGGAPQEVDAMINSVRESSS
ncbi:MAG: hypothetical protein LBJ87_15785 [bacterium]|nr:hypothetical protein [bacterium]